MQQLSNFLLPGSIPALVIGGQEQKRQRQKVWPDCRVEIGGVFCTKLEDELNLVSPHPRFSIADIEPSGRTC